MLKRQNLSRKASPTNTEKKLDMGHVKTFDDIRKHVEKNEKHLYQKVVNKILIMTKNGLLL